MSPDYLASVKSRCAGQTIVYFLGEVPPVDDRRKLDIFDASASSGLCNEVGIAAFDLKRMGLMQV